MNTTPPAAVAPAPPPPGPATTPAGRPAQSSNLRDRTSARAPRASDPRDLRPLWRGVLAVLLPLGPLAVAVAFALRPFGPSDEPAVIIAKILASPWTDLLLWLGFLAPGLLLLAAVTAGHLARRRAPVLATVATTINALAFGLMSGAVASGDLITVAGGRAGIDPATIVTITGAIENPRSRHRAGHLGARPHPRHGPAGRRAAPRPRAAAVGGGRARRSPSRSTSWRSWCSEPVRRRRRGLGLHRGRVRRRRRRPAADPGRRLGSAADISVALTDPRPRPSPIVFRYGGTPMIPRRRLLATLPDLRREVAALLRPGVPRP